VCNWVKPTLWLLAASDKEASKALIECWLLLLLLRALPNSYEQNPFTEKLGRSQLVKDFACILCHPKNVFF
jgi:hypothetical protein